MMLVAIYGTAVVGNTLARPLLGWHFSSCSAVAINGDDPGYAQDAIHGHRAWFSASTMKTSNCQFSNEFEYRMSQAHCGHDAGQDRGAWQICSWRFGVNSFDVSG